ncbi:MAG: hypothetical protein MRK01_08095 [Candidatus Scalindua sp.]|nr:hypothetical protein [Candidatus Scalindua sp.]
MNYAMSWSCAELWQHLNKMQLEDSTSRAISEDADQTKTQLSEISTELHNNITLGEPIYKNIESLINIFEECSTDNWDGYGAKALTESSLNEALRFIRSLPITMPSPELSIEPSGEIAFEWHIAPRKTFCVSVDDNLLTYAGIFGSSKTHGTEYFEYEIPKTIIDCIQRVFQ